MKLFSFKTEEQADAVLQKHGIEPTAKVVFKDNTCEVFVDIIVLIEPLSEYSIA